MVNASHKEIKFSFKTADLLFVTFFYFIIYGASTSLFIYFFLIIGYSYFLQISFDRLRRPAASFFIEFFDKSLNERRY